MNTKMIEIRDHATCIPAIAIKVIAADCVEDRFLWRCGYPGTGQLDGQPAVILMKLYDQKATSDPYEWCNRTMHAAHVYVLNHFDELAHGQVVDARVVLHEATEPAASEIWCPEDRKDGECCPDCGGGIFDGRCGCAEIDAKIYDALEQGESRCSHGGR